MLHSGREAVRARSSLPTLRLNAAFVSSIPPRGECANAIRPRSVRAGHNMTVRNRRVRTRSCSRALALRTRRQGWPLPPSLRQRGRRESHDAIERPPPSSSQPRRLRLSRQPRVRPGFFSSRDLHSFVLTKIERLTFDVVPNARPLCPCEASISVHDRHWRSSTIGLLLSNRSVAPVWLAVRRHGIAR